MTRYLVAYYSWTGNTAKVARAVADGLGADVEEITETKARAGGWSYFRSAMEAIFKTAAPIASPEKNVADYDVVILGFPVWAQNMASPMRSYVGKEAAKVKSVAAFCTLGGMGGEKALAKIEEACGRPLEASLIVDEPALNGGEWRGKVDGFVRALKQQTEEVIELGSDAA